MAVQHGYWGQCPQTPYPDGFVAAARCQQRVLVVDRDVSDLGGVATQRGQESTGAGAPDLYEVVVCTLIVGKG